jgi:membrane associated rhomboid family serine protease
MFATIARVFIYGLIGLVGLPVVTMLLALTLGYLLDPRCGTPGDSGGCEMGAATVAIASALPGLAIGVALAVFHSLRRRQRHD